MHGLRQIYTNFHTLNKSHETTLRDKGTITTADLNEKPKTDITCRLSQEKERP